MEGQITILLLLLYCSSKVFFLILVPSNEETSFYPPYLVYLRINDPSLRSDLNIYLLLHYFSSTMIFNSFACQDIIIEPLLYISEAYKAIQLMHIHITVQWHAVTSMSQVGNPSIICRRTNLLNEKGWRSNNGWM